ncbi:MAG: glycosyltransferase family 2 protein [Gammaproteobacteria bacterium]|nr:glycosyltransferase family 2 protein [Gammaproteobacteria bacterium]
MVAQPAYSIVLPAKNEAVSLAVVLPALKSEFPQAEIIVVDDGSTDMTADVCAQNDVVRVAHQVSLGNGAAIKSGARRARGKAIVFMDADSQHNPQDIHKLLSRFEEGSDMVVGARTAAGHANVGRLVANTFYSRFASWVTGRVIPDLTSGFRVVNRRRFMQFLHLLPNGFSYPTTITMAFMRAGYDVEFVAIPVHKRVGRSHIRILRDGLRFLLIIFKVGTLYSPLRIFLPVAATFFVTGLCYYLYTFTTSGRFTNMSALLFINAVLIFMIGLVSEQITALTYSRSSTEQD